MTPTPTPFPIDHFQCYKSKIAHGAPKFTPSPGVTVVDHYSLIGVTTGYLTVDVKKVTGLCNPANINGLEPSAPTDVEHGVAYQTRITAGTAPFVKVRDQQIYNPDFGTLHVDVLKPMGLFLPSAKNLVSSPPPLVSPITDHYSCYKAKVTSGTPRFTPLLGVTSTDQFGSLTENLKKPTQLCVPANVNNQEPGAESHVVVLLCYQAKRPSIAPKFTAVSPVFVNNDYGPLTLNAVVNNQICVPALIQ